MLKLGTRWISFYLALCLSLPGHFIAAPAMGKETPDKASKNSQKPAKEQAGGPEWSLSVSVGISLGEARELAVEHGLTGYKPLPPGIRKNLERGKPMPPGIAKTRMPQAFLAQLPRHDGYEWRWSGSDLVLVAVGTLIVAHVLVDVFK